MRRDSITNLIWWLILKNEALELRPVMHAVLTNGYEINSSDVLFLANLYSMSTNINARYFLLGKNL